MVVRGISNPYKFEPEKWIALEQSTSRRLSCKHGWSQLRVEVICNKSYFSHATMEENNNYQFQGCV